MQQVKEIPLDKIKVGEHEQRLDKEDEGIAELSDSIRRLGLLVPLVVAAGEDAYTLIAGHRRLKAAGKAGLSAVPCIIEDRSSAVQSEVAFAENFFRKDLSPVELAAALKDCLANEAMTAEQLAAGFHRSVHWVNSMIAICSWPEDVQIAMHVEGMSIAAASNLACVTDDVYRKYLLENAVLGGVTARTTAAWLQAWRSSKPPEVAVETQPVQGAPPVQPLVPQAPCFFCSNVFPVNEMSHVPLCGACIKQVRAIG